MAPVWDGNETWLVLGGAGLMAAFPLAYSVILHALHLPLVFMLLGLIFRGVAFEFRFKADERHRPLWDRAFVLGSICATFFQGVALGAYIEGIPVVGRVYQGGPWDWISPFSLFTGAGLVAAYALLGCTWLIMKTEGALQRRMCRAAKPLTLALLAVIAALSLWTPLAQPQIAQRWFSLPNMFWFLPVPLLVAAAGFDLIRRVRARPPPAPSCCRWGWCSWATAAWASASGRPSFRRTSRSGRRPRAEPGLRAGGRAGHHPGHPDVHGLVLLRVPRQGARGRGVSLMQYRSDKGAATTLPSWRSRLLWLALIWAGSVAALGVAAWAMRLAMRAIGMSH